MAYPVPSPGDEVQYHNELYEETVEVLEYHGAQDEALLDTSEGEKRVPHSSVVAGTDDDDEFWTRRPPEQSGAAEEAVSDAQSEASDSTTQDTSEDEAGEEAAEDAPTFVCGSTETADGSPCGNEVDSPDATCHLH